MSGESFTFKQFVIRQDRCAMKVGTDGALLGAWACVEGSHAILDVGTGTGLLALMAAQRAPEATVTAIEIDSDAAVQAQENAAASPFASRINVLQGDVRTFTPTTSFNTILCNPPYFERALRCPDAARATARHDDTLTLDALTASAARLLSEEGTLSVVLPTERRTDMVMATATHGLFLSRETLVKTLPHKEPKRVLLTFARQAVPCHSDTLCIEETPGVYSSEFIAMMQNFYLKL